MTGDISFPRSRLIDLINAEEKIPLETASQYYPQRGSGTPCLAAVVKHVVVGIDGWRLETAETSAGIFTSREAVTRFIDDVASERRNLDSVWRSLLRPLTSKQLVRSPDWARRMLASRWA